MIRPAPRQLERPQQRDYLLHIPHPGEHQICIEEHREKHGEEKHQKAVAEPLALHPARNVLFPRQAKAASQQAKQLSPAAIPVAISLGSLAESHHQRDKKAE